MIFFFNNVFFRKEDNLCRSGLSLQLLSIVVYAALFVLYPPASLQANSIIYSLDYLEYNALRSFNGTGREYSSSSTLGQDVAVGGGDIGYWWLQSQAGDAGARNLNASADTFYAGNAYYCSGESYAIGTQTWSFTLDPAPTEPILVSVSWRTIGNVGQNGPGVWSRAQATFSIHRYRWYQQNEEIFSRDFLNETWQEDPAGGTVSRDISDAGDAVFKYDPAWVVPVYGGYYLQMYVQTATGFQTDNPTGVSASANARIDAFEVHLTPIPEPAASLLLAVAVLCIFSWTRRFVRSVANIK